jgi:hypothetical protein
MYYKLYPKLPSDWSIFGCVSIFREMNWRIEGYPQFAAPGCGIAQDLGCERGKAIAQCGHLCYNVVT